MQKMSILGITLTDYSLKESLLRADDFVKNGAVNTILYVTTPMLILAGRDEEEKQGILSMDMTLCGDPDILRVGKVDSKSRVYEVENLIFLKEFLRRIVRSGKSVYLLSDSKEDAEALKKELRVFQKAIGICGVGIMEEETEDIEELINNLNDIAPSVIVSRLAIGRQERLMTQTKPYVNAEVWLGLPRDMKLGGVHDSLRKRAVSKIYKKIFRHKINKYNGGTEENQQADLK